MRCAEAMSLIWHTGHSEEIHSPDECARTVVRRRRPASLSMPVAWIVAISCRPRLGIAEGAVRLARKGGSDGGNERLLWIGQLHLGLGKGSRNGSDCITGAVHGCRPPRNSAQALDALMSTIRTA